LKLEGSLVADLVIEERARVIAHTMTELSHSLGMQVVAEGIENVQMLRAVAQAGCDIAQGFLIAKPMIAADLFAWLDSQTITDSLGKALSNTALAAVISNRSSSGNQGA